jgi:pyridoxamine--pyruvate transaminase
MQQPDFTLAAGPVMAWPEVLAAQSAPIVYHYDPVFLDAFRQTERAVGELYRTGKDILLMQGEAVLGLEAAARGLVRPGTVCLNLVSGIFGYYMGFWLRDFGGDVREITVPYNEAIDAAEVEHYLDEHPDVELLTVVHSETPSGTLNPVEALGQICKARGVLTLVDCVSSVGGMPLWPDAWQLDVCVAGPQKCLGGPPGMSLMCVSDEAWAAIGSNPSAPRGSFLSMLDWKEQWLEGGKFPFTPSVVDLYGVRAACERLIDEGLEASFAQHELAAEATRAGVRAMGLELWPRSDDIAAACVTAIPVPDGLTDEQVRAHCRERYGVMISGGQGAGNLVRIGHMGPGARSLYPVAGLTAVGRTLSDLGASVKLGDGIEAAMDVLGRPAAATAS